MKGHVAYPLALQMAFALGGAAAAHGQVVISPVEGRFLDVRAEADGIVDQKLLTPPTGQPPWNETAEASVDGTLGDAEATAIIGSLVSSSGTSNGTMVGNGQASGVLSGIGSSFHATSYTDFLFSVPAFGCISFGYYSGLGGADLDDVGFAEFQFLTFSSSPNGIVNVPIGEHSVVPGEQDTIFDSGQLSEGQYSVRGRSMTPTVTQTGGHAAPDYSWLFNYAPCVVPLIDLQPHGGVILAGQTATMSVGAASAAAAAASGPAPAGVPSFTYQWRHGGQDLVDGGRISGATTDTLTITSFGAADAGGYNVWVSDGSTRQLSTLAILELPEPDALASLAAGSALLLVLHRQRLRR